MMERELHNVWSLRSSSRPKNISFLSVQLITTKKYIQKNLKINKHNKIIQIKYNSLQIQWLKELSNEGIENGARLRI